MFSGRNIANIYFRQTITHKPESTGTEYMSRPFRFAVPIASATLTLIGIACSGALFATQHTGKPGALPPGGGAQLSAQIAAQAAARAQQMQAASMQHQPAGAQPGGQSGPGNAVVGNTATQHQYGQLPQSSSVTHHFQYPPAPPGSHPTATHVPAAQQQHPQQPPNVLYGTLPPTQQPQQHIVYTHLQANPQNPPHPGWVQTTGGGWIPPPPATHGPQPAPHNPQPTMHGPQPAPNNPQHHYQAFTPAANPSAHLGHLPPTHH